MKRIEQHPAHADRYERAIEFAEVVTGLWDSWDEDAFIRDKGRASSSIRRSSIRCITRASISRCAGPLNVGCSPQGRPVLVQAGASGTGRDVAARMAELVFTARTTFEQGREFYGDVMGRLPRFGRSPAEGAGDARPLSCGGADRLGGAGEVRLPAVADPSQRGLAVLEHTIGVHDLDKLPLDGPVPRCPTPTVRSAASVSCSTRRAATSSLCGSSVSPRPVRADTCSIGRPRRSPTREHWFKDGACDGFNVMPAWLPGSLTDFVDLVIPELQRRGLFGTEYEAMTLRENLGLPRPISRFHADRFAGSRPMTPKGPVLGRRQAAGWRRALLSQAR